MTDKQELSSPSLLRRLAAMLYDTLLVLPLIMASVFLFMGLRSLVLGAPEQDTIAPLDASVVQLIALLTLFGFFSGFWLKSGQTLGMQAWRLKLVCTDGGKPGLKEALLRCLTATLSAACLGLGYLWCIIDRDGLYWHDRLSGTQLALLPRRDKNTGDTGTASAGPAQ